jgi:hypothetical protein
MNKKRLKFIIVFDARSGSTKLSKLLTEKYNATILPETNFIFQLFNSKKFSKKEIIKKIYNEKKFNDLKIKKIELKKIINDNFQSYEKIINEIVSVSNLKIYKCKSNIGLKKNQIEYTKNLIDIYKSRLKIIFLIRDPRNVLMSKINTNRIRHRYKSSTIINIYQWIKIHEYLKIHKIKFLYVKYESLDQDGLIKVQKYLNLKVIKNKNKEFFLPKDQRKIHPNLNKLFKKNISNYEQNLKIFDKIIINLMCYNYLKKFNYINNKNFLYYLSSHLTSFLIRCYVRLKVR